MAVPREVIRIPTLRGLHIYPDKAPLGSASRAENVEFTRGGVSPRNGCLQIRKHSGPSNRRVRIRGMWTWEDHEDKAHIIIAFTDFLDGKGYIRVHDTGGAELALFQLSEDYDKATNRVISAASGNRLHLTKGFDDTRHNNNVGARYGEGRHEVDTGVWGGAAFQPMHADPILPSSYFIVSTTKPNYINDNVLIPDPPGGEAVQMWAIRHAVGHEPAGYYCNAVNVIDREYSIPADTDPDLLADDPILDFGRPSIGPDPLPYWGGNPEKSYLAEESVQDETEGYITPPNRKTRVDVGLVGELPGAVGPSDMIGGQSLTVYRNRLVLGNLNTLAEKNAIRFNNVGDLQLGMGAANRGHAGVDDPVHLNEFEMGTGWPLINIQFIQNPDNSRVVAVCSFRDLLVVFKERSTHLIRFTSAYDLVELKSLSSVGIIHPNAFAIVSHNGEDVLYLCAQNGFYAFDGQLHYLSGPIEQLVHDQLLRTDMVNVVHRPRKNQVWFQIYGDSSHQFVEGFNQGANPDKGVPKNQQSEDDAIIFIYDYQRNAWTTFNYGTYFQGFCTYKKAKKTSETLLGVTEINNEAPYGYSILDFDQLTWMTADTFDNATTEIRYSYVTQRIAYNHNQVRRWSHIRLSMGEKSSENKSIEVFWLFDNQNRSAGNDANQSANIAINAMTGVDVFGTGTFGNARFAPTNGFYNKRIGVKGGPARTFRVGVESHDTPHKQPWLLNGIEIDTRRKEGRR